MSSAFRFAPPAVRASHELRWVLAHAFGPGGAAATTRESLDTAVVLALARQLGVGPRLGLRITATGALAGTGLAAELARGSSLAAASQMRAHEAAGCVAEVAVELGTSCCFLKGVALDALGLVAPGSRPLADVDVLVETAAAPAIARRLQANGFTSGGGEYPHQLAPLVHPRLGAVELHLHLPGVRLPGRRGFATLDDLTAGRMVRPWPDGTLPPSARVPAPPALAAHLLAHGLAQHGFRPAAYPGLRLVGDLIDLGLPAADGEALLAAALLLLAGVPPVEARAAAALARGLASGLGDGLLAGDDPPARLLRHLVAGALDEGYRERLKLQELRYPLAEGGAVGARLAGVWRAVLLSREQVDALYGRQAGSWGYLARRLTRPLDLMWRTARAASRARRQAIEISS
jgi:hypothetical protein